MDYNLTDYDVIPNLEDTLEFEDNPDQRTPCVLLLDTSYSMAGEPILELNQGLKIFKQTLMEDSLARRRVEVSVLTFGGQVDLVQDFVTADQFNPPTLHASGGTPMGEAIDRALDRVAMRKTLYAQAGVPKTLPWVFLITDGAPTDDWQRAAERVRRNSDTGEMALFAVGVQGADMHTLGQIAAPNRPPVKLAGLQFRELFAWLSQSLRQVSRSVAGAQVALPPPKDWAEGWGQV
ncbi:MAG TPA: VWA domain-containing protein [Gammaproteobacteria bacterium]|nr:VWA domain-containing protein [Gammaproteobacteria bacterium]